MCNPEPLLMPISAEAHAERRRAKQGAAIPAAPRSRPAGLQVGRAGGRLVAG